MRPFNFITISIFIFNWSVMFFLSFKRCRYGYKCRFLNAHLSSDRKLIVNEDVSYFSFMPRLSIYSFAHFRSFRCIAQKKIIACVSSDSQRKECKRYGNSKKASKKQGIFFVFSYSYLFTIVIDYNYRISETISCLKL